MVMVFLIVILQFFASAEEVTSDVEASTYSKSFYDSNFILSVMMSCFTPKDFANNQDARLTYQMNVMLMANSMADEFERRHLKNDEIIAFLAHTLHETRMYQDFVQPIDGKYCRINMDKVRSGGSLSNTKAYCQEIDRCNREAEGQANTDKIGFGLIHTTGCDTIASTIDYLNTGDWKKYWEFPTKRTNPSAECTRNVQNNNFTKKCFEFKTLGRTCTKEDIRNFKRFYSAELRKDHRKPQHLDIFENRRKIANPCNTFNVDGKKVSGADLAVKAAIGFFDGKCDNLSGEERSVCVNGGRNGADERSQLFKRVKSCFQRERQ